MTAPSIEFIDLIRERQGFAWQSISTIQGTKVRYQLDLDTSYTYQSRFRVEAWTPNGWTEVWTVNPNTIEKVSGPDRDKIVVRIFNNALIELYREARFVLGD